MSTGLLDHLLRTRPGARFTIVCGPPAEGVFARMPRRETTYILVKQPRQLHWLGLWRFAASRRWDLVVDIRGSALSWIVRTKARAVGRPRTGPKIEQLARILDLSPAPLPVVWTAPGDEARASRLPAGELIALAPTANWVGKIWPAERFVDAFRLIAQRRPGAVPVIFGGPGDAERALAQPVIAALPTAIDLVGALSLPEASACLARCAMFIGNDSGLMHLAAAAGVPTLGLFGPTPAGEYAPAGARARAIVSETGDMAGITAAAVSEAALNLMPAPQPGVFDDTAADIRAGD